MSEHGTFDETLSIYDENDKGNRNKAIGLAVVAALGGFLFG